MHPKNLKINKKLGSGQFGTVYLVQQVYEDFAKKTPTKEKKFYAMKMIEKRSLKSVKKGMYEWLLTYIKAERDILAKMRSPFIVKLHSAF